MSSAARRLIEAMLCEVEAELSYLARELNMSDDAKAHDAAYHMAWNLGTWAEDNGIELPPDVDLEDTISAVEMLDTKHPEIFSEFSQWALNSVQNGGAETSNELPWTVMSFERFLRDAWMVHFSDDAQAIWNSGFKYGVDPMDRHRLALTTHYSEKVRLKKPGLNFAFAANRHFPQGKYGKEAVMFRADGIEVLHYGDDEHQAIFLGRTAHDPVYLYRGGNGWAAGHRPSGEPIFSAEKLDDVVEWVQKNYDQYHKALRPTRENPAMPQPRRVPSRSPVTRRRPVPSAR